MRDRAEILFDGMRKTDKNVMIPEFGDKLELLKLEVLIDIRDVLNTKTERIAAAQKNILDNL
ncbi:hypothetical protein ES702_06890 [subsurface metagenome]